MTRWAALGFLGAALAAIVSASARADVVEMPMSCPEGSAAAFCHGPATCAPRGCVSASDCNAGEVCAARSLCIETHTCYGIPMSSFVDHVLGACDASGACASPGNCESLFVCATGPVTVDTGTPGVDAGVVPEHVTACACRAGAGGGSTGALALALAMSALWLARRRR